MRRASKNERGRRRFRMDRARPTVLEAALARQRKSPLAIAALERIDEHQTPARLQRPGTFAEKRCDVPLAVIRWNKKNACHRVLARRLRFSNDEVYSRPSFQLTLGVCDIWLGHIETEDRKRWLGLFDKIKKAPGPTADVEKSQFARPPTKAAWSKKCGGRQPWTECLSDREADPQVVFLKAAPPRCPTS
jgi:hypothetical protein